MDISTIPKTFWHALSVSVLVVTGGLVTIAYRSASVSIEIANAKIGMSRDNLSIAIDEAKQLNETIKRDKDALEKAFAALEQDRSSLANKVANLEIALNSGREPKVEDLKKDLETINLSALPHPKMTEIPAERFEGIKNRLNVAQQQVERD